MKIVFAAVAFIALVITPVLTIQCYECNIYEDDQNYECLMQKCPDAYNVCTIKTFSPSDKEIIDVTDCYHEHDNGTSYRGNWTRTVDDKGCMNWDANYNFTHNAWEHGHLGLGEHNFCRNPDGDMRPWCYTSLTSHFAYCSVPKCQTHISRVAERRCGWLNKNFCKDEAHGRECYVACEYDLCNRPPGTGKSRSGLGNGAMRLAWKSLALCASSFSVLWTIIIR